MAPLSLLMLLIIGITSALSGGDEEEMSHGGII